jgi:hypothetical protein
MMARNAAHAERPVATTTAADVPDAAIARSRGIGALVAVAGALLMILGIFLPWLEYADVRRLSGWKVYQDHVDSGGNGFVVTRVFSDEATSILFTGFTILIAAILVVLAALWVLGLARKGGLGLRKLEGPVAFPAIQLANLALGLAIIDLVMVLAGDHADPVQAGPGLFVVVAGGLLACIGMFAAVRTRRGAVGPTDWAG